MRLLKRFGYLLSRKLIKAVARPRVSGLADTPFSQSVVYVLERRALSDIIILDLVCTEADQPNPLSPIHLGETTEPRRFFFLRRPTGWRQRNTMKGHSKRLLRILATARDESRLDLIFVPVAVFWGRSPNRDHSIWHILFSENWAATSRFRRLLNLTVNRYDIVVNFGQPLSYKEIIGTGLEPNRVLRRTARLLRVQLRNQRVAAMGPDFSHRRTLVNQILQSSAVKAAISSDTTKKQAKLERRARKYALSIASNMSYTWVRVLARLLSWIWNRIYKGIEFDGIERIQQLAESHTLIYVPSHRSHVDYLLLSYLLFQHGLMVPHVAAGDNLNLPILGGILRKAGAFFLRRSFRDDHLYSAVFTEYLYQVYRRGHCVEFFPEGGRSRTGRLLPPKPGLLKMTLEHHERGVPRPLAFVPVYFGYEKLIEASAYLDELRGSKKKRESWGDLFRNIRLIRQNFGKVFVNIGEPIIVDDWLSANAHRPANSQVLALGRQILRSINGAAYVNPVNAVSLVTLATPKIAIERAPLARQIELYRQLLDDPRRKNNIQVTSLSGDQCIDYVKQLGLINEEKEDFGTVCTHSPFTTVLMTWYRNNVAHCLALPSLIACLTVNRRRPISVSSLQRMVAMLYPYLARELSCNPVQGDDVHNWCERLAHLNLLVHREDASYSTPAPNSEQHQQLNLLAKVISQTLERMFIVVGLMGQSAGQPHRRDTLLRESQEVAHKMSRLYGLNAPEFFDRRLFNQFFDQMLEEGVLTENSDGTLTHNNVVDQVLRASESVIDPEFRFAVMRARPKVGNASHHPAR